VGAVVPVVFFALGSVAMVAFITLRCTALVFRTWRG
jgi:hypothetical protein